MHKTLPTLKNEKNNSKLNFTKIRLASSTTEKTGTHQKLKER